MSQNVKSVVKGSSSEKYPCQANQTKSKTNTYDGCNPPDVFTGSKTGQRILNFYKVDIYEIQDSVYPTPNDKCPIRAMPETAYKKNDNNA